jgi:hypothetical protein
MTGTILLASTSRWTRPTSASSTAKAWLFMRASRRRRRNRSRTSSRKRRAVVGSYSRQGEWRRSCFTGCANSTFPWSVSRAGRPIRRSSRVRHSRRVGGATWSATDETVEIFVEADTNELSENRRRFALIQHPSPSVQPSNRRGHETKERKASIAEKSAQPSTLLNLDHETAAIVKSMIASADRRYSVAQPTTLVGVEVLAKKRHFQSLGLPPWWT